MGCCLGISMNSKSDWLKSEVEHYQHCYQRMEKTSPCQYLYKWLIFQIFTVSSCTTKQLKILSAKVLKIWTKCLKCALFESNNDTALNKKCNILLVLFSPGSAKTYVWCDGNINSHLMASCVWYIHTTSY